MEMRILVQNKKADPKKLVEFVSGCASPNLVIVYSSLDDREKCRRYFQYLVDNLEIPFIALTVTGTVSSEDGYTDDSIAAAVLCGDFQAKVSSAKIDFDCPEKTAEEMFGKIGTPSLCFTYGANYIQKTCAIDAILRRLAPRCPQTLFYGGILAPPPLIATREGIFEDHIAFAAVDGIDFEFCEDTGFLLDESDPKDYVVTKSDEKCVYEINGRSALDIYSELQHMRPYITKTLVNLGYKPKLSKIYNLLSKTNPVLYEGVLKIFTKPIGVQMRNGPPEVIFPLDVFEDRGCLLVQSYKPEGTVIRKLKTSKKDQLAVYERLKEKSPDAKAYLMVTCEMEKLWSDFDYERIHEKVKALNKPFLKAYVFGEIGTQIPYDGGNVVNQSASKTLAFK